MMGKLFEALCNKVRSKNHALEEALRPNLCRGLKMLVITEMLPENDTYCCQRERKGNCELKTQSRVEKDARSLLGVIFCMQ